MKFMLPVLTFLFQVLIGLVGLGAIAYLACCLLLFTQQNRFIFFPSPNLDVTPDAFNLAYEDVWIPAPMGNQNQKIHGWWLPARGIEQCVVLHFHGNGHNIAANLWQALQFHQVGCSVLMIDYRGYGRSAGPFPSEARTYQDAEAAWNYLVQTRQIAANRIIVFGHSLGGAIAIHLALRQPQMAGLIVQSSFTSMQAMVEHRGRFWMFPINLLLTQRFPSIERVKQLQVPVLYLHGTADELIPTTMSQTLYEATNSAKQLHFVAGAAHNNVAEVGGSHYTEVLGFFIQHRIHKSSPSL
jgi:pimeloyl-ACP methyl ester carboxylesterase